MHPQDIPDFIQEELYGEQWRHQDFENILEAIYGGNAPPFLDPATLVIGETDFGKRDAEFGYADVPAAPPIHKYSFCPKVPSGASARRDILTEFLDEAVRKDSSVAQARSMMQGAPGHNPFLHDCPSIEEDAVEQTQDANVEAIAVEAANRSKPQGRPLARCVHCCPRLSATHCYQGAQQAPAEAQLLLTLCL